MDERADPSSIAGFRSIYREHFGLVWGAVQRLGVEEHQLDDAVQETFLVAYRRMASFTGGSAKAWLYAIARRVASNYRRTERRAKLRKDEMRRTVVTPRPLTIQSAEAWQALDHFIAGLPERHRELFVLSEVEGMTGAEAARALGLRPSTAYDALRALRARLRADMAEDRHHLRSLARRARPRATARSWSALLAVLPTAPLAVSVGSALSLGVNPVATGLGAIVVLAVGLGVATTMAPPREPSGPATVPPRNTLSSAAPAAAQPHGIEPRGNVAEPPSVESSSPRTSRPIRSRRRSPAPPSHGRRPPALPPAPPSLATENALLRDAAAALAAEDPARALVLANRHIREYVDSPLADAGVALRIQSLCRLDKRAQARGEARVFLRRRPGSPVAHRIESACPKVPFTAAKPP
ncbi:MAG: RNA polymerase sigma factor [Deltaproteobacteria bacterium]|nr:RNA polymerase sigma factor [Deltaproteobacteria bacterium]